MARRPVALASFVVLALSLTACDPASSSPDAAALDAGLDAPILGEAAVPGDAFAPSGTLADYCGPLAALLCSRGDTCGCGALLPGGALDVAACTARWQAECESAWAPFVAAGARVDPARASACVDVVADATPTCAPPSGLAAFALCAPFVIDPAAIGGRCTSPYCADGDGVCDRSSGGMCVARGGVGAPCTDMFSCATGLACLGDRCAAPGDVGAPCAIPTECLPSLVCVAGACTPFASSGASCADSSACEPGLVCEGGHCATRTGTRCDDAHPCGSLERCAQPSSCRAPLGLGGACRENADCEASLWCEDAGHTCVSRPGEGMPCANGVICAPGLGCDMDGGGTCRALGGAGSPCFFGEFGPFLCAEGLACVDGTCGALPTEGQPCAGVDTCAAGLGCAFGPGGSICVVPRGEAEACENRQACRTDLFCGSSGTCEPDVAIGAPCDPSLGDCGGACVLDESGGFTCRAPLAEGAGCLANEDCGAGLTCLSRAEDTRCFAEICASL